MKRQIIVLFFITFSAVAQNKIAFSDSLRISYTCGDESIQTREMTFQIKNNKVYGRISIPNTDALISSETILGEKSIDLLNSFLQLATKYRDGCQEGYKSSYIEYYDINLDNQNFSIHKFCDWKIFTYTDLEKQIFSEYQKKLKIKEKEFNLSFSNKILGKWKESENLDSLKVDSKWNLHRLKPNSSEVEYFEILKNQNAVLHRKGEKTFYKFRIEIIDGKKYFGMHGDDKKNGDTFVYGHMFLITEVNNNEIKMIH